MVKEFFWKISKRIPAFWGRKLLTHQDFEGFVQIFFNFLLLKFSYLANRF
jgi:hypothetical protein